LAVFPLSRPHNSIQVHVSLSRPSHLKHGPTWCAVCVSITNRFARWPLLTGCPTRRLGVFFGHLARKEQDDPLIPAACLWEHLSKMRSIILHYCSPPVPQSCSFMEPEQFFSQFNTFHARLTRPLPCLCFVHGLPAYRQDSDAGPSVQEECSRGGRYDDRSHLGTQRAKRGSRAKCRVCSSSMPALQAEANGFAHAWSNRCARLP
jgi:hypothetical protein